MPTAANRRGLVLALALLPFIIFGLQALWRATQTEVLFPAMPGARDIGRIEIARGTEQVVLHRKLDTGAWVLLSAEDAPGDKARIEATLEALRALRGEPVAAGMPAPRREGLELRLSDRKGREVGHAIFWTGEASRLPDRRRLGLQQIPALPLWPSAWSTLQPPKIAPEDIVSATRISPGKAEPLSASQVRALSNLLAGLSATGFVPARQVNWAAADYVQAVTRSGALIEVQAAPAGKGEYHLRLTSDRLPEVRAVRAFAFQSQTGLP